MSSSHPVTPPASAGITMMLPRNLDLGTLVCVPSFSLRAAETSASLNDILLLPLPMGDAVIA